MPNFWEARLKKEPVRNFMKKFVTNAFAVALFLVLFAASASAQAPARSKAELGSQTAKNGFKNEAAIEAKFNDWKTDADARDWLVSMGFDTAKIERVSAARPHGEKSDVSVKVRTADGEFTEGISIKLVSGNTGFNQVDKRWLADYARMWKMPSDVVAAMRLFVGEVPPNASSRRPERMYFNEMEPAARDAVLRFFSDNRETIVSDILEGDGTGKAKWFMVAQKKGGQNRSVIVDIETAIGFFGEGKVEFTRNGNLKIGRISMQRKGGDAGRETAKMLQFKINPALLFDMVK